MTRVKGIGGIFFKSKDPETTRAWYKKHLGIESGQWGGTFEWRHAEDSQKKGYTAWSVFKEDTQYTEPGTTDFMINYRVENLEELLATLKDEGVQVVGEMETYEYGKFGWVMDPTGQKVELWEPFDAEYEKMVEEDANNKMS